MSITTVTTKGQTTIPEEIRRALQIKPGDKTIYSSYDPVKKRYVVDVVSTKNVVDELYGSLKSKVPYAPPWKTRKAVGKMLAKELGLTK